MPIRATERKALVAQLRKTKEAALRIEQDLRIAGREPEADLLRRSAEKLDRQIDELFYSTDQEWAGPAEPIRHAIRQNNETLRQLGPDLRGSIAITENLAKVISAVDQTCEIAAHLLGNDTHSTDTDSTGARLSKRCL